MMHRTQSAARRPAAIVVKVAILMPVLLAVVALALDTGMIYDRVRHSQATADASALAAAGDLFNTYSNSDPNDNGRDPNAVAANHALAVALANGYPNDGTTAKVDVYIPPVTGQFVGKTGYVEVVITYYQTRVQLHLRDRRPAGRGPGRGPRQVGAGQHRHPRPRPDQ